MKKIRFFITIFIVILVASPTLSQEIEEGSSWKVIDMPFNYQNIQVPRKVWALIKEGMKADGADKKILENFSVLPISVGVELYSENNVVLRGGLNYRLNFVEGGGEIDFFDYLSGKGPFQLRMVPDFQEEKNFHLLYVSESPGEVKEGNAWGNGCGKIFDLSEKADVFTYGSGVNLTASRRHYLHLMAGTYIFFQLIEERLYLGYIRLTDSRYPSFQCKGN